MLFMLRYRTTIYDMTRCRGVSHRVTGSMRGYRFFFLGDRTPPPPTAVCNFFCLLICPGPCNNLDLLLKFLYEPPPLLDPRLGSAFTITYDFVQSQTVVPYRRGLNMFKISLSYLIVSQTIVDNRQSYIVVVRYRSKNRTV